MTLDCTTCGAPTALHMLTHIGTLQWGERRSRKPTVLCPGCYEHWLAREAAAAESLRRHPGRPGPVAASGRR